jgi:predicted DNA-binding protein
MKSKRRPGVINADAQMKQRVNVRMSPEAHQRLQIHSVMSGKAVGEILDELVTKHCRDWKVSANVVARSISVDSVVGEHSVDLSAVVQA